MHACMPQASVPTNTAQLEDFHGDFRWVKRTSAENGSVVVVDEETKREWVQIVDRQVSDCLLGMHALWLCT